MKTKFSYILICILISACSPKSMQYTNVVEFDYAHDTLRFDELFSIEKSIHLEAKDGSLVTTITKMEIYDNKFFVLDANQNKLLVFNDDGTFNCHIGNQGNGSGEYYQINDFSINKENKQIAILSYPSYVFVYDIDGNFAYKKELAECALWHIKWLGGTYLCTTDQRSYLEGQDDCHPYYFYDTEFNLICKTGESLSESVAIPSFISNPIQCDSIRIVYFDCFKPAIDIISQGHPESIDNSYFLKISDIPEYSETFYDMNKLTDVSNLKFFIEAYCNYEQVIGSISMGGNVFAYKIDLPNLRGTLYPISFPYPSLLCTEERMLYTAISVDDSISTKYYTHGIPLTTRFTKDNNFIILKLCPKNP